jgi:hypothetical protein
MAAKYNRSHHVGRCRVGQELGGHVEHGQLFGVIVCVDLQPIRITLHSDK